MEIEDLALVLGFIGGYVGGAIYVITNWNNPNLKGSDLILSFCASGMLGIFVVGLSPIILVTLLIIGAGELLDKLRKTEE